MRNAAVHSSLPPYTQVLKLMMKCATNQEMKSLNFNDLAGDNSEEIKLKEANDLRTFSQDI